MQTGDSCCVWLEKKCPTSRTKPQTRAKSASVQFTVIFAFNMNCPNRKGTVFLRNYAVTEVHSLSIAPSGRIIGVRFLAEGG